MSWTVRAEVEAVVADFGHWTRLGVHVVSVQPAAGSGARVDVRRFEPWMQRAMRTRYDFPVECRQQGRFAELAAAV